MPLKILLAVLQFLSVFIAIGPVNFVADFFFNTEQTTTTKFYIHTPFESEQVWDADSTYNPLILKSVKNLCVFLPFSIRLTEKKIFPIFISSERKKETKRSVCEKRKCSKSSSGQIWKKRISNLVYSISYWLRKFRVSSPSITEI